jgi:hypothetical protein
VLRQLDIVTTGWATGVEIQIPVGARDFAVLNNVQTGCGDNPFSYTMGTGTVVPGLKRQGPEAVYSSPSSTEVKNNGATSPYVFMAWCLIN